LFIVPKFNSFFKQKKRDCINNEAQKN